MSRESMTADKVKEAKRTADGRVKLDFTWDEWREPLYALLSVALMGLKFYPALLLVIIFMVRAWRNNRYDFIILSTLLTGAYGFIDPKMFKINTADIAFAVSVVLLFLYRKPPLVKKALLLLGIYAAGLLFLATFSLESIPIQLYTLRNYLCFIVILIPLAVFGNKEFEIGVFFKRLMIFGLIISSFNIIDVVIFDGNILVPQTFAWGAESTFAHPHWHPLSFDFTRKMPHGMLSVMLCVYPAAKYFILNWKQWAIFIVALLVTQTFTLISGVVLGYIILRSSGRQILKYFALLVVGAVGIYFIDGMLPETEYESGMQSTLRIKSSVDQIFDLYNAADDEDISRFASGRLAQIMPKMDLVFDEHRQWTGLGFLHPDKTKITRYIIDNEYYTDVSQSEELATGVENVEAQVFINVGFLGLALFIIFFVGLWYIIRKLPYAGYYTSVVWLCMWLGTSGWANPNNIYGLALIALSFAAVVLNAKTLNERKTASSKPTPFQDIDKRILSGLH